MPPHIDAIQRVAVQDVDSTVLVYRLRLLVHQSAALWDIESHNSLRRVVDRLPLSQICNHVPFAVLPRISHILGIGIVDVVIILRPIRPSLLFMFGIVGVVPAFIVYETPVYPRHMQPSAPKIPTVDVRVALQARQRRADEFPETSGRAVQVQVVGAEASFTVAERHEHGAVVQGAETRVGHVTEVFVGAR